MCADRRIMLECELAVIDALHGSQGDFVVQAKFFLHGVLV